MNYAQLFKPLNPDQSRRLYLELLSTADDPQVLASIYLAHLGSLDSNQYTAQKADGSSYTYRYQFKPSEQELAAIAQQLVKVPGATVSLRGVWLWVEGQNLDGKALKALGCRENKRRSEETNQNVWNWSSEKPKFKRKSKLNYDELKSYYGDQRIA